MASVSPSGSGVLRFLAVAASLALAGCETISMQSSGSSADSSAPLPATSGFRYALVSPASSRETRDAAEIELIHRAVCDSGRLSEKWSQSVLAAGLSEGEYVEIVGIIAMVSIVDTCTLALGLPDRPLPQAAAGMVCCVMFPPRPIVG